MRKLFAMAFMLCAVLSLHAQSFAVNTDVAKLALQTYNLGAEMTVGQRSTLGIEVFANNKPYFHKDMKVVGVTPEWRYYFGGRPMYHHFIGVGALAMRYNVDWKDKRYKGDAAGAGITFGYVVALSRRWNLDAHAGLGLVFYHERQRYISDDMPELKRTDGNSADLAHTGYQILPTKIGITLSYIIR